MIVTLLGGWNVKIKDSDFCLPPKFENPAVKGETWKAERYGDNLNRFQ
jgi:hypothetical protein